MTPTEKGYLERDYLEDPYLSGGTEHETGFQVNQIINKQTETGMQAEMVVNTDKTTGMQTKMIVDTSKLTGMQADMFVNKSVAAGMQSLMNIVNKSKITGMQADMIVKDQKIIGMQALMNIENKENVNGMQVDMEIEGTESSPGMQSQMIVEAQKLIGQQVDMLVEATANFGFQAVMEIVNQLKTAGMEAKADTLRHWFCERGYLEGPYLEDSYLTYCMRAFLHMQAQMRIFEQKISGMQADMVINKQTETGFQADMLIEAEDPVGMQAEMIRAFLNGMQATMVIYNVTQLRVMCEFPSRGTAALGGTNWSTTSQAPGDYGINNVNTDIVEQTFRSQITSITITCDTGLAQGVPTDTIAILNHNMTTSALVQVQGSKDNFATSPDITFDMTVTETDMFWISPNLPNIAGQNRYWRFVISDSANPDGYIEIGAILFGASDIFSLSESFNNPIVRGFRHFKDSFQTEGFTNISNDRALKKYLRLQFEKLNYFKNNYSILEEMLTYARTSLKCLIIPTPEFPERFAIFAKVTSMPEISHTSIDERTEYIDLDLEWDESL